LSFIRNDTEGFLRARHRALLIVSYYTFTFGSCTCRRITQLLRRPQLFCWPLAGKVDWCIYSCSRINHNEPRDFRSRHSSLLSHSTRARGQARTPRSAQMGTITRARTTYLLHRDQSSNTVNLHRCINVISSTVTDSNQSNDDPGFRVDWRAVLQLAKSISIPISIVTLDATPTQCCLHLYACSVPNGCVFSCSVSSGQAASASSTVPCAHGYDATLNMLF
jgi:hypothetical protein